MKVYAFVGPSGTGKSHRAQYVANQRGINYIIDDGLVIKGNKVICGISAKRAPTKIETVKHALFQKPEQQKKAKKALKEYKAESILIIGTSDKMVEKIAENLKFPKISEKIYIEDVATQEEIREARSIRIHEGKHVIPVPTFEIKKDFSGFLLDPLQIFKWKGKGEEPYITEKSIIRPSFSYMGNYTISDAVFRQISEHLAGNTEAIYKVLKNRVANYTEGIYIYMEVSVVYGFNVIDALATFKEKCIKEIERLTTMNVYKMEVIAKAIHVEGKD